MPLQRSPTDQVTPGSYFFSSAHRLLPTAYSLQPTAYNLLPPALPLSALRQERRQATKVHKADNLDFCQDSKALFTPDPPNCYFPGRKPVPGCKIPSNEIRIGFKTLLWPSAALGP